LAGSGQLLQTRRSRSEPEKSFSTTTGYYANRYDESLFPLEIVGDYFLGEEEQ
jgi:hypothetical protein